MKKIPLLLISMLVLFSCTEKTEQKDKTKTEMIKNNPLVQEWNTPFGTPPFDKIKSSDYLPAIEYAIQEHNSEIQKIIDNKEKPSFKNTIVAMEQSGGLLKKIQYVFDALESANTDDVLKETAKKVAPELAAHQDEITMNKKLYKRVEYVYKHKDEFDLDAEDQRLLKEKYKSFVRSGVALPDDKQTRMKQINKDLAKLQQQFNDNLLAETNDYDLYITDEKDLGTMPENVKQAAQEEAKKRGHKTGWSFTLQRPSFYPFLDYSPNRELRKKIFMAYANRGNNNNAHDNKKVLEKMVQLRAEKAHLLGYNNFAEYVLDDNMAKKPSNVYNLMDNIWSKALQTAKSDRNLFAKTMKNEGIKGKFQASDWRYYVRKIRSKNYNFDETQTKPYFEVNKVRDGAFLLANKLFGLKFKKRKDIPVWHKDQQVFEVLDKQGKHLGVIYMDFFARPSKRGGAWMNELRMQSNQNGKFVSPIVTNNFNFPAPTKDSPSLLSFSQAQTVFHEFGHGLHGLLSNVKYASLSGTNVSRDFVEFPSQVMENWMSDPAMLKLYAKHYKTGKVIPKEMIDKMNKANAFNEGFRTVEYMAAAYLDMDYHTKNETIPVKTLEFEKQSMNKIGLIDEIIPRYRSTYYAHIFGGGYAAGYYSYLWAAVLDADTFNAFKKSGDVFNPELAKKYKTLISSGGSKEPMQLYKDFLGREPKIDALMERKGFNN